MCSLTWPAYILVFHCQLGSGLGLGLEEVFVFDSKSENRDIAVEVVEAVSEAS